MAVELAFALMFFVAIITGITSIFTKKALISLHATQFNAGRGIIDFVMLIILAPVLFTWPGWQAIGLTAFVACIGAVASMLIVKSMRHKNISEITPLFNFSPFFIVILAYIFLGERLNTLQLSGIIVLMLGAYVLQADKKDFFKPFKMIKNKYVLFIFIAIFLHSNTATMEKAFLGVIIEPLVYLWWVKLFLSTIYLGFDYFMYGGKEMKNIVRHNWKQLSLVSSLGWIGLGLMYIAIPLAPISVLIPIKRTSSLFSTLLGGKFFNEGHLKQRVMACAIMLIGAVLIVF